MGGYDEDDDNRDEVLQLDCPGDQIQSCQWKLVGIIQYARYGHVVIPVPESFATCN